MPIKLFISDFDRTLTDENLEVDGECMNYLKILKENKIKVATVSGRGHSVLKIFYERHSDAVDCFISENGCIGYLDGKKHIISKNEEKEEIMEYLRSDLIPFKTGEVVISIPTQYHLKIEKLIPRYNLEVIKNIDSLMILPRGISKGTGIKWLQDALRISKHETACIGDGENDVIMRDFCSFLGAQANAVKEMKEKADYVCKNSYSKGTIEFIEKILNEGRAHH